MRQEDLNAMMRYPGEARQQPDKALPECPVCGQRYLGDGVAPCLECAALQPAEQQPTPDVPEGWALVPKELIDFLDAKEHHLPVEDRHVLSIMLAEQEKGVA